MNLTTALKLGRVSNLPTVWSNVLAGMVLAGAQPTIHGVALVGLVASLLYVGGMYLNDAFDAKIDAVERPERPIPAGEVSRRTVLTAGLCMLGAALGLMVVRAFVAPGGRWAIVAAVSTASLIVVYDKWHKGNPGSPIIMGLCRVGVYAIAALSVTETPDPRVLSGALLLLSYVLGLTYVAKYENKGGIAQRWPLLGLFAPLVYMLPMVRGPLLVRSIMGAFGFWLMQSLDRIKAGKIPAAVGSMIAGIALLDAMLIARYGGGTWAWVAVVAFGATVALQRKIAGT